MFVSVFSILIPSRIRKIYASGSGSFNQKKSKKNFDINCFVTFLKTDLIVPTVSNKQKY
jgi:hypothetical protein